MKVSILIAQLQAILDSDGDLQVFNHGDYSAPVDPPKVIRYGFDYLPNGSTTDDDTEWPDGEPSISLS